MARTRPRADLPTLDDPAVPSGALLGPDARSLLAAAVDAAGGELRSATPRQASYSPGRSLTVRFETTVRWGDGRLADESLVATAGGTLPEGALVLNDGHHDVAVWRLPHDPRLPGLAAALDPDRARQLLADLGAPVASATPRLRAYRPGRRAVVEISAPGARLFLKLVRPGAVDGLQRRHTLLAGHVPVPASLGWSPDLGLVALQAVAGRTVRAALDQRHGLPTAASLLEVLDRLPAPDGLAGNRAGWQSNRFAGLIAAVAPELADRVKRLADRLDAAESEAAEPWVPVHGDLHEAQLLVDGGRITGLLDVDTFGLGHRVDDLATMIGHLATLAGASPRGATIERFASRLLDRFDRAADPVLLRQAVAAVVLGLATGPFRVLDADWRSQTARRVDLAERWWDSAARVAASAAS